ncbi:MAG: 7-cyano-7-deazaguanine synthase QueC [Kiritimatiellae bacterium]|nr:7-cyano-7-deazaguanine synthase QueC [Kiritimatiellia bacterium]
MSEKTKAVVVLSGGQDSAICLKMACNRHGASAVAAITFNYGQRHSIETKFARLLARRFGVKNHKTVKLDFYRHLTTNALLDKSIPIRRGKNDTCPTTVVEGRNAIFLLSAGVWAKALGAKEIWTGVSEADYSGYPDCRAAFIRAQEKTMRLAMEWPFKIVTPFMHKTKAQEWAIADRLGILELVENGTVTCYNGIPGKGCGKCPACILRAKGLAEYMKNRG